MKKTVQFALLSGLLAGASLLSSCYTTVNTVERAAPIGRRQAIADKRIITDPGLNKIVNIVGLNEATTPGGFLQVQIEVLNKRGSAQNFSYRFEWFDMNGMLVDTPTSAWIPRQIEGAEMLTITAVAPVPAARDFRVKFIENVRQN